MAPETQISDSGNETLSKGNFGSQAQLSMDQTIIWAQLRIQYACHS
jgi:hypothetical protein